MNLCTVLTAGMAIAATFVPRALSAAELALLMFEQPGCIYCQRWDEEIGPQYPLTDEGRAAPLRKLSLRAPLPDGIHLASPPAFTPTFVVTRDGTEVGRIAGYPGDAFFWPMLADLLAPHLPAPHLPTPEN